MTARNNVRSKISAAAKSEITQLSGAQPVHFIMQIIFAWAVIATSISIAIIADHWLISLLAIIIIATRQNIFGLLTHEQAHYLGLTSKYGDWICNALVSYPLLILSVENYAKVHLAHHHHFFSQKDPDFHRKNGASWLFPMPSKQLLKLFLLDVGGLNVVAAIKGKNNVALGQQYKRKNPTPLWFKLSYYILLATLLTLTHSWMYFLIYWVIPIATVLQVIIRWGAICEHIYGVEGAEVEDCSPVITNKWWEKLLLPNLNFTLHPYHHYFPAVSFSKLPRVHEIFLKEDLVNKDMLFHGYKSYWRFITRKPSV